MTPLGAQLRVCASCEWIFNISQAENGACPKCGFGHYSARYVYGKECYRYKRTQEPWLERHLAAYSDALLDEIDRWNGTTAKRSARSFGFSIERNPIFPIHNKGD